MIKPSMNIPVIDKETIRKHDVPGPRYTSYPTAPVWSGEVDEHVYARTLTIFGQSEKTLSLYIHIPFCQSMCRFCACSVIIRPPETKYGDEYLKYLFREINLIAAHIGRKPKVHQLHWGGGTPTYLSDEQIAKLFKKVQKTFDLDLNGEVAIEIDPRTASTKKLTLLKQLGFNRISMGIQDFNEDVQERINRVQPFDMVQDVYGQCRRLGFKSINLDLIYGLPGQTPVSFHQTIEKVTVLRPDRIALYSFAYVPWLKKHQQHIQSAALPTNDAKLDIFLDARSAFLKAGYQAIAMDHFALKGDDLSEAFNNSRLHRNFMGYTVKPADEYIGLGMTSIGFLENTFVQNQKTLKGYFSFLDEGRLPVERGKALTDDDVIRQWVINSLMCHFTLDKKEFCARFGRAFDGYFAAEQDALDVCAKNHFIELSQEKICVTGLGRIFIRNICMTFDQYLKTKTIPKRYSQTV